MHSSAALLHASLISRLICIATASMLRQACMSPLFLPQPQSCAPDRSNEFAAHRFFRLYLDQRFVTDFGRRTLSECGCRKADSSENEQ
jgi:hypothetical protein